MSGFGFGAPPTVLERLNTGLRRRTVLEDRFQLDLFNRILQLLRELNACPAAVAALPSGTAGALSITEAELSDFIRRLTNPDNMDAAAVEDIVDPLHNIGRRGDDSLRRNMPGLAIPGDARDRVPRSPRNPPRGVPGSSSSSSSSSSGSPGSPGSSSSSSPSWISGLPSLWGRSSPRVDSSAARSSADGLAGLELDDLPGGPSNGLPSMSAASRGMGAPGSRFGPGSGPPFPGSSGDPNSRGGRRTRRARKYRNRT